jgi:hypothetical protein
VPRKDPEARRAYVRAWYARTKTKRRTPARVAHEREVKSARRHALAEWFVEMKSGLACRRCGENHPACLQFHHVDADSKDMSISDAVRRAWSRDRVLAEARKCEVLCANCHMKHHAGETTDD